MGSRTADDEPADVLDAGFQIPVGVAAIDPDGYAEVIGARSPPEHLAAVLALQPGSVLLTETSADLRGVGPGGVIDLANLAALDVVGVVPDGTVGRGEIILHSQDATAAGLDEDGTVYVRHDAAAGQETDALAARIEALVPADLTARIVRVGADDGQRRGPLVLSLAEVKSRFGEFAFRPRPGVREIEIEPAFAAAHIVTVDVPLLGTVTCHEDIIAPLRGALETIAAEGLAPEIDPGSYGGCYYPRRISTSGDGLSHHSWGIALDINVDLSLPDLGPPPHPGVVAAFEEHGFRWGGDFLRPDNHHFEWIGEVEPVDRD